MALIVRCPLPRSPVHARSWIFRPSPPCFAKYRGEDHRSEKHTYKDLLHAYVCKHLMEVKASLPSERRAAFILRGKSTLLALGKTSLQDEITVVNDDSLSGRHSINSESDNSQTTEHQGACISNQKLVDFHVLVKKLLEPQVGGGVVLSRLQTIFIGINAIMLIQPNESLAEACESDTLSAFNMPLLFVIALIGATVGGLLARQRRGELERLNDQLRQINAALRRQAKIESYAPNLSYAPVGRAPEKEVIVDSRKQQLISNLKTGKNFLRNQDPEMAFKEFKAALELAQSLGDPIEEKKAARGLGASLQRLGKYRDAIKYHSMVLAVSEREGEDSGNTEAYGAIADCYTELGDLERAAKFYDKYIARLETD